ncbi:MAG: M48 family metallopeptidase, partial [Thermodesulfobacteriota bacterium]|nr:M48 family metallopeptidase [Thermodesulfobacteriota bacterium]
AGLAVVMGHEVAHALAKHGNERMSQALLVQMGGVALAVALSEKPAETQALFLAAFGVGTTVGVILPFSRRHEYEADRIGLTLMAKAGYDPRTAVGLWQRMKEAGKGKRPPEFLSTHPAPDSRIETIKGFIPEALRHYKSANDTLPALKTARAKDIRPMPSRSEAARLPGISPPCVR